MWPNYSPACRKAVNDLLKQGGSLSAYRANKDYGVEPVKGSYAWKLEREVERRFGVKHCVAVNSGTAALHCALASLDLKGEEVITSPFTFSATVSAILLAGGVPRFADIDPHTFCITKETVKRVLTKRTKAILPVSLFGGMADVRGLASYGLPVLEDACQAVGARDSQGYSGTQGIGGAYSFNGGKNIPAGEAGAFVTNDDARAETARLFMNHGENFHQKSIGVNYRMNEITACVAYYGLLELEERNTRRQELVRALGFDHPAGSIYVAPRWENKDEHVFYVTPFLFNHPRLSREQFAKRMAKHGVPVGCGYIQPHLARYKAFKRYARGPLPVVEELSSKTLCILSTLTPDRPLSYAEDVAKAMRECLR
jgi:dTDP-4-amino-4,6-dideoxygalactose transaminase